MQGGSETTAELEHTLALARATGDPAQAKLDLGRSQNAAKNYREQLERVNKRVAKAKGESDSLRAENGTLRRDKERVDLERGAMSHQIDSLTKQ